MVDVDSMTGLDQASALQNDDDARPKWVHRTGSTKGSRSNGLRTDLRGLCVVIGPS